MYNSYMLYFVPNSEGGGAVYLRCTTSLSYSVPCLSTHPSSHRHSGDTRGKYGIRGKSMSWETFFSWESKYLLFFRTFVRLPSIRVCTCASLPVPQNDWLISEIALEDYPTNSIVLFR